jgi:hypothetical protein
MGLIMYKALLHGLRDSSPGCGRAAREAAGSTFMPAAGVDD